MVKIEKRLCLPCLRLIASNEYSCTYCSAAIYRNMQARTVEKQECNTTHKGQAKQVVATCNLISKSALGMKETAPWKAQGDHSLSPLFFGEVQVRT